MRYPTWTVIVIVPLFSVLPFVLYRIARSVFRYVVKIIASPSYHSSEDSTTSPTDQSMFSASTANSLRRSTSITLALFTLVVLFSLEKTLTSESNKIVYRKGDYTFYQVESLLVGVVAAGQELLDYLFVTSLSLPEDTGDSNPERKMGIGNKDEKKVSEKPS